MDRTLNAKLGKQYIQRNWELQFVGIENEEKLEHWLFDSDLKNLIPKTIIKDFYTKFKEDNTVYYSHSVSLLLTLALKMKQLELKK